MTQKAILSVLLLAFSGVAATDEAPVVVSPAQEYVLAQQERQRFLEQTPLVQDPVLVGRVRRVGSRVAAVSDRPDLDWAFYVAESGQRPQDYQAFSLAGGTVVVTRALLELYADDDSLSFALGHEVAHLALRHHFSPLAELAAAEEDGDKQLGRWVTRFRHQQELAADRYGALYAVRAGFSFSTAVASIRRLGAARQTIQEHADHPGYADRAELLEDFRNELALSLDRFEIGLAALDEGDLTRAVSALELFVQQFPSSVAGRVNLGTAHLVRVAERATGPGGLAEPLPLVPRPGITLRGGSYDLRDLWKAQQHYRAAIGLDPGSPKALVGLALIALRQDEAADAQSLLERALDRSPADPDVLLSLGNCRYLAGEPEEAAERYGQALELRDSWAAAERNLALAHLATGKGEQATELWRKLLDHPRYREEALRALRRAAPAFSALQD